MLSLKKIAVKFIILLLQGLISLKNYLALFSKYLLKPLLWLGGFFFGVVIYRLYQFYFLIKKRFSLGEKLPDKKFLLFLNRHYFIHLVIILIGILTTIINTQAYEIKTEDLGEKSLLFSLVGLSEEEIIEEEANFPGSQVNTYLEDEGNVEGISNLNEEIGEDFTEETLVTTVEGGSALLKPEITDSTLTPKAKRDIAKYVVEEGDTVSGIAQKFGVNINTILWENNLSPQSYIKPGEELTILPVSGVRHKVKSGENLNKIANNYQIALEKIKETNKLTDTSIIKVGDILIIPGGSKTYYRPKYNSPLESLKNIIAPPPAKVPISSKMLWPTPGRVITQYFTWRHHGLDIDGDYSSPIYAAESGKVIYAGWNGGYGISIDIDHGDGTKTRYGHMSKLFVSKGDYVNKGDTIGMMGSTGRSTGSHLHFEVFVSGKRYNPLNYIK